MNYPRTYRNELYTFLKKYPEDLKVYYNHYGDMDTFKSTFVIKDDILYLSLSTDNFGNGLNVGELVQLLKSVSDKNIEVSTYYDFVNGHKDYHCNMPIENIYFK